MVSILYSSFKGEFMLRLHNKTIIRHVGLQCVTHAKSNLEKWYIIIACNNVNECGFHTIAKVD